MWEVKGDGRETAQSLLPEFLMHKHFFAFPTDKTWTTGEAGAGNEVVFIFVRESWLRR